MDTVRVMRSVIDRSTPFDYPKAVLYEGVPLNISGAMLSPDQVRLLSEDWVGPSGSARSVHASLFNAEPPKADVEDLVAQIMDKMYGDHCAKAVVKCAHCGQFAARYCACRKCGAPVE